MAEQSAGRMLEQAPVLLASDMARSVAYWDRSLGFRGRVYGDPPDWAVLRRDRCFVMLGLAPAGHEITPFWKIRDQAWNAYFWVDDAKAVFDEFKANGAIIDYGLAMKPYGVLEFGVQDPDGHDIAFGQDMD